MKLFHKDLYSQDGLSNLHERFLQFVKDEDPTLHQAIVLKDPCDKVLIRVAEYVEEFLKNEFDLQESLSLLYQNVSDQSLIAYAKRQFVQRHALKLFPKAEDDWQNLYDFKSSTDFSRTALDALEHSKPELNDLAKYAAWAVLTPRGQKKHQADDLFQIAQKIDPNFVLQHVKKIDDTFVSTNPREREGFALTDHGFSNAKASDHAHYCILCHNQGKDSCRTGIVKEPKKSGCPLDQKISQMHDLKRLELNIAALAVIMIDNPMVAATGHRICNDCMKACIFQKQTSVNTPGVESNILNSVLNLPFGFEIYSLLTRWNPLNFEQPLPYADTNRTVLVVGLGPAGFSLAHYLSRDGHTVIGIDGAKLEPLPAELLKPHLIKDVNDLYEKLDERIQSGFGGVAEYGITVRWNKNYLKIIRIILERRPTIEFFGSTRFGSQIHEGNYQQLGIDAVALCSGAGAPRLPNIEGALTPGVKLASDFLMALQLAGASKQDSLVNLQILGPILVIGGGLTAIDTATEAKAYYKVQQQKFKNRYDELLKIYSEKEIKKWWTSQDHRDFDHLMNNVEADVKIIYRSDITNAPSYNLNHEEIEKALEEGIIFQHNCTPLRVEKDDAGHAKGLWVDQNGTEEFLSARTIIMAVGTHHEPLNDKYFTFGDANPTYAGSVVKAIASAKYGYKKISEFLKTHPRGQAYPPQFFSGLTGGSKNTWSCLLNATVISTTRLTPNLIELKIHAPLAAAAFQTGQFYRLQNFESTASYKNGTRLCIEAIALTPVIVDKQTGIITFVIVEIGASSLLVQHLQPAEIVSLMGPTGTPTDLPKNQNVLLIGGGHFNLALIHLGLALKEQGNIVHWIAGYSTVEDRTYVEAIEFSTHKVYWYYTDDRDSILRSSHRKTINSKDHSDNSNELTEVKGNTIDGLNHLRDQNILQTLDWLFVMGSTPMQKAIAAALFGHLKNSLKPNLKSIANINIPMQCIMQGICGQCIIPNEQGPKFCCKSQEWPIHSIPFDDLLGRSKQNSLMEKISRFWLHHCNLLHILK